MIGVIGISYKTSALPVRERLIIQEAEQASFIELLKKYLTPVEIVILCTCNRSEIYFYTGTDCIPDIFDFILEKLLVFKKTDFQSVNNCIYRLQDEKAVRHLFAVTSGLDSLVLGENEILGQVKHAYAFSAGQGYTSAVFNRLFHKTFEIGKIIRTQTTINRRASSVSSVAIELCRKKLELLNRNCIKPILLQELPILLIGTGNNGEKLLKNLIKNGCRYITVMSRNIEHARVLASHFNLNAVPIERLSELLDAHRLIITSTASPVPLISKSQVLGILEKKAEIFFIFVDLSVPRDIEPEVKSLPQVTHIDLDDLKQVIVKNQEERKEELVKAIKIIQSGIDAFYAWMAGQSLIPTIKLLKARIGTMTLSTLEAFKKTMNSADSDINQDYSRIVDLLADFSARIEKKYMGLLIKNLKLISETGKKAECIRLVNQLFELESINDEQSNKGFIRYESANN